MRFLLLLLPLAILAACSEDNPLDNRRAVVTISPDKAQAFTGDTVALTAAVTGVDDTTVIWSVSFADNDEGRLLPDGRYIAPDIINGVIAVVIIRATSNADPLVHDEAVIHIRNRIDTMAASDPVEPGVGSGYIFASQRLDSLKRVVPGSQETDVYTVLRINTTVAGRSDATIFLIEGFELPVAYESNGDLSIFTDSTWMRLPFGSRSSVVLEDVDTTLSDGTELTVSTTATYRGSEEVTVDGRKLTTYRVVLSSVSTRTTPLVGAVRTTTTEFWFAPAIGWFTRIEEWSVYSAGEEIAQGSASVLESFTVK